MSAAGLATTGLTSVALTGPAITAGELAEETLTAPALARVVVTDGTETFEARAVLVGTAVVEVEIDYLGRDEEAPAEALLRRFVNREINATELRRLADEIL